MLNTTHKQTTNYQTTTINKQLKTAMRTPTVKINVPFLKYISENCFVLLSRRPVMLPALYLYSWTAVLRDTQLQLSAFCS